MIVAKQKPLEEIIEFIEPYEKVLILGCGACVTVCQAGGEAEVKTLASALRLAFKKKGKEKSISEGVTIRQCEWEFCEPFVEEISGVNAVLSLACGVGVNFLAERIGKTPVLPGLDTTFYGGVVEHGHWAEMCAGCGKCILHLTGGICPVARCAKTILNGPCGGCQDGKCELGDRDCAWYLIVKRMEELGALDKYLEIQPPKDWSTARDGGPRTYIREDLLTQKAETGEEDEGRE